MTSFKSNSVKVKIKIDKMNRQLLEEVLIKTEVNIIHSFYSFPKPPIDTGQLRNSITHKILSSTTGQVTAGGNLQKMYAPFIEFGTVKMGARPFFRTGIKKAEKTNPSTIRGVLKSK